MRWWLGITVLAASAAPALAGETAPNLRACARPASPDAGERERTKPLPIPAALRGIVRSSLYHYAVSTLRGGTVCDDVSWVNEIKEVRLSSDRRFLSYTWYGYESYGQKLIDRSGRGRIHEIGAPPLFSPSGRLFAAIDQTESEFGALSGFKVWRVTPASIAEAGAVEDIPRMYDWRIDRWTSEACLSLSAIPFAEQQRGVPYEQMRRDRFVAKLAGRTWRVLRASGANRCR